MSWWTRFSPNLSANKGILPATVISAGLVAVGLLSVWQPQNNDDQQMDRYGQAMAHSLALSSAGHLLHRERIELVVIANQMVELDEIAGVMFLDTANKIIAISGSSNGDKHYTAPATLDDTITGYASVVLTPAVFASRVLWWRWLASFLIIVGAPVVSLLLLQLFARGNRSLPIVSVPATPLAAEQVYCLAINLHNQMALDRAQKRQAVTDAADMATEVCAIHQGLAVEVPLRGVIVLLAHPVVNANQALSAGFLVSQLLAQFETAGEFRCYIDETTCPGSPTDLQTLSTEELARSTDIDTLLTLAALAKPGEMLISESIHAALADAEQEHCQAFKHPLLSDMTTQAQFVCTRLPTTAQQWVDHQAALILGFNQASA